MSDFCKKNHRLSRKPTRLLVPKNLSTKTNTLRAVRANKK